MKRTPQLVRCWKVAGSSEHGSEVKLEHTVLLKLFEGSRRVVQVDGSVVINATGAVKNSQVDTFLVGNAVALLSFSVQSRLFRKPTIAVALTVDGSTVPTCDPDSVSSQLPSMGGFLAPASKVFSPPPAPLNVFKLVCCWTLVRSEGHLVRLYYQRRRPDNRDELCWDLRVEVDGHEVLRSENISASQGGFEFQVGPSRAHIFVKADSPRHLSATYQLKIDGELIPLVTEHRHVQQRAQHAADPVAAAVDDRTGDSSDDISSFKVDPI